VIPERLYSALRTALELDLVDESALIAAGLRPWDAKDLVRRLGEIASLDGTAWRPEARDRHRAALAGPARALDLREHGDRPREKALRSGIEACDDAELLALVLRHDRDGVIELAHRLLESQGGLVGLARLSLDQLTGLDGLGEAKASELAAAFELGRRLAASRLRERPPCGDPATVAALLVPLVAGLPHEEFWCLPVDPRCRLIGEPRRVSHGDVDGTDAGPRAFLRIALTAGASGCLAVHNHPSGDPTPSPGDLAVTRRLAAACRTVDLALHDHLIVAAGGGWTSLRRERPDLFAG
jgi:DNA repair protein RadC